MNNRKRVTILTSGLVLAAVLSTTLRAGGDKRGANKPQPVVVTGRVTDTYSFMTGQAPVGEHAIQEHTKFVRDCIKSGVPACLETEDGVMLLGKGPKAAVEMLAPLAYQQVEARGKLYEKGGIQYLDIIAVRAVKVQAEHADEEGEEEADDDEEEP